MRVLLIKLAIIAALLGLAIWTALFAPGLCFLLGIVLFGVAFLIWASRSQGEGGVREESREEVHRHGAHR